ncbi:MAG: sigma-70 family RNA polymerase sigma factor [Planctomyces sp.]|nr:sigma-70 family RNA polymerase sigma factor [Planctomyces sp.]
MNSASPQSIFLEHEGWLRTVVRSRVSEPDGVEDVMQNIALAIVRHRKTLTEIQKIGAWLYQIAVRQVLMYRRTTGRRRRMMDRLAGELPAAEAATSAGSAPVQAVIAAETSENVQKALAALNDLDRQILMLKYTEQWSYRQLSEHLGVKEDTVEYRLLRARKNLKRLLRQYGEEGEQLC